MKKFLIYSATVLPGFAFAAGMDLKSLAAVAANYLNIALELLMGFAVLAFVWYIVKYFIATGDKANRSEAAMYLLWSIIGFAVIVSMWGLVNVVVNTFNLGTHTPTPSEINGLFPR